jgi:hypothetical protein
MTGWLLLRQRAPARVVHVAVATLLAYLVFGFGTAAAQDGYDYDCTDFDNRRDAQVFYEESGGPSYDPYNLDDDEDGIACEEWAKSYEQSRDDADRAHGLDGVDRDCADFGSQAEAQRYFDADGGSVVDDIDHLDPNHNGIACENGEPG